MTILPSQKARKCKIIRNLHAGYIPGEGATPPPAKSRTPGATEATHGIPNPEPDHRNPDHEAQTRLDPVLQRHSWAAGHTISPPRALRSTVLVNRSLQRDPMLTNLQQPSTRTTSRDLALLLANQPPRSEETKQIWCRILATCNKSASHS
jgi:hypothetical protein